ncbi:MAG: diaminopimelate epimerase [Planctomycetota bacterium]|jgi:diaminopimelate epimerase|nr:diaminopimelate epimerase [Planctomycetota bacterium]
MRFTKMHGCGNDYVYLDLWEQAAPSDPAALARAVSDRHRGIGADGLILIGPSAQADAQMVMFNADGSQSQMCGNGLRCATRLAWDHGHLSSPVVRVETGAGILDCTCLLTASGRCEQVRIAMGQPRLDAPAIPVSASGEPPLSIDHGVDQLPAAIVIGMGNPHAVLFVDDPDTAPVTTAGPVIERHQAFPERTNVEFVARLADENGLSVLRQRTWERGSGETEACGTGACAATVAAMLTQRIPYGEAIVRLNGGDLRVSWDGHGTVFLQGEAVTVFEGDWP